MSTFTILSVLTGVFVLLGAAMFLFARLRERTIIGDIEAQLPALSATSIDVSHPHQEHYVGDEKRLYASFSHPTLASSKESIISFSSHPNISMVGVVNDIPEQSYPLLSTSWMEGSLSSSSICASHSSDELVYGEHWRFATADPIQAAAIVPSIVGVSKLLLHVEAEKRLETQCSIPTAKSMEYVIVDATHHSTSTAGPSVRSPLITKEPTNECWWTPSARDKENRPLGKPSRSSRSGMLPTAGLKRTPAKREAGGPRRKESMNRPPWGSRVGLQKQKTTTLNSLSRGILSVRN